MSAFSSLLNSIGGTGDQPNSTTRSPPVSLKPVTTNGLSKTLSKSGPTTPSPNPQPKPEYKGTAGRGSGAQPGPGNTLKRKAEDPPTDRSSKLIKPISNLSYSSDRNQNLKSQDGEADPKSATSSTTSVTGPAQPAATVVKPPAKGSYAEMMARAKQAAQTKTPSQVGMIKHQATEKLKASKLAERRRAEQEKTKGGGSVSATGKNGENGKLDPRGRSVSPAKATQKGDAALPKHAKQPLPPLHAPARPQAPLYKGTLGQGSKRPRESLQRNRSRYDEYLGTDEEDEDDFCSYGEDEDDQGGYSDASSDMEAGFDDVEREEDRGLREAKRDDARELALENKLKREKLERQKKMAALAAKRP